MSAAAADPRVQPARTFTSVNPATGEVVGEHAIDGPEAVAAAAERARPAARWWAGLGFDGRRARLRAWKASIARRSAELSELLHRENGKPVADALLEIALAVDHLEWASTRARGVLGPRRVPSGLTMLNQAASVEYQPLGVIGVIGPWNCFGETGAALCTAGVDKLAFTGTARTGRTVMAACARTLTPVLMECGGKDALIVAEDADVEAAADAAVWGAMSNAGQTCIGIDRARRPRGGRRLQRGPRALLRPGRAGRRPTGCPGRTGGDVRADAGRHARQGRKRGRGAGQRQRPRPGLGCSHAVTA